MSEGQTTPPRLRMALWLGTEDTSRASSSSKGQSAATRSSTMSHPGSHITASLREVRTLLHSIDRETTPTKHKETKSLSPLRSSGHVNCLAQRWASGGPRARYGPHPNRPARMRAMAGDIQGGPARHVNPSGGGRGRYGDHLVLDTEGRKCTLRALEPFEVCTCW